MTTYLFAGVIDDWNIVSGYKKGKNRVDVKQRIRKLKKYKGIKNIKVLECLS